MAFDARLIQENLNRSLQSVAPATNLLSGIQTGQGLVRGDIQNQLLQQRFDQSQAQAPLEQQLLQQKLDVGAQGLAADTQAQELAAQTAALQTLGTVAKTLKPFIDSRDLIGAAGQIDVLERMGIDPEVLQDIDELISAGDLDEISNQIATIETFNRANAGEGEIIKSSQRLVNIDGKQFSEVDVAMPDGTLTTIRSEVGGGIAKKTTGETIKEQRDAEVIQKKLTSTAGEEGKLEVQKQLLPQIRASIKRAEKEAANDGELAISLSAAKAALPGIKQVVTRLKSLADDATFTLAGSAFNRVAKEFGFSTKGDTARARMISIVDNQVLPLLKPIFGAAFTAVEGDRLRNSFLDPDSTPDSRRASLDSFLQQMERNIETKERELNPPEEQRSDGIIKVDANGNRAMVFPDGTFKEL